MCLLVLGSVAHAKEGGNGGDSVLISGKHYLLDLVEAGVEDAPYIDRKIKADANYLRRVKTALPGDFPHDLIAKKLTEVKNVNPVMSLILLKTLEMYQWKVVNSELLNVRDENSVLKFSQLKVFQAAIRRDSSVLIDKKIWKSFDDANKTALVFHEILYAVDLPKYAGYDVAPGYPARFQTSERAREINGYLFSELPRQGQSGLDRFQDFDHINIPAYTWDYSNDLRIKESESIVTINPFLRFDMNVDEWGSYSDYITTSSTSLEIEDLTQKACSMALKNKTSLKVTWNEGKKIHMMKSNYYSSRTTKNSYVDVSKKNGYEFYQKVEPTNLSECVNVLKDITLERLKEFKESYH